MLTLPLEATYNGNPVKINPNDVQFGFLKISLQSIGELEGGSVNTTKTELVFDYPEAGTISGFDFTPNAEGKLRTLTIGAVQKSKLPEFQATINQEFARVYQIAKANGYSDEEAAIQAQTAAVNLSLIHIHEEDQPHLHSLSRGQRHVHNRLRQPAQRV